MKRWMWSALIAIPLIAAGVTLVARPRAQEWTTSSPEALAEFEAGLETQAKVYFAEAGEHFGRALELDPDFLIAKYRYAMVLYEEDSQRAQKLLDEVATADLSALTAREKFIIERWRALREDRGNDADRLLDDYVAKHPNDPYGLSIQANRAWGSGQLEEATRLYQHLLEIDPNWVNAYNALGYIAMTRARFTESEEYFKSFRFVVPDQANPHDSLGELFTVLGRYGEAEDSFERAIEIKPDFWASYHHLVIMKAHSGDPDGARAVIARALAAGMAGEEAIELECLAHYTELAGREAWWQILDERDSGCVARRPSGYAAIITHRAACRLGDWTTVQEIEDRAGGLLLEVENSGSREARTAVQATISHLQGVRLATQGDFETAQNRLLAADQRLTFLQTHEGIFKIYNSMILVETLLAGGQDAKAHQLLAEIRATNPPMIAEFERSRFKILGLKRG
jgi:tetratricopeptide (TPR) repeat protein